MKLVLSLVVLFERSCAKVCRALVLGGGGSNGAWESGVLWGLTHYGDPDDYQYDVVTGVSVGSINTISLAGWPIGQEKEATEKLSGFWQNLHSSDIWK